MLKSLHPEPGICHSVLVHPPGGLVGGDSLAIAVTLARDSHALITTPGATRFYRSTGAVAEQSLSVDAAAGSRLEWLPLETIVYSGCEAENRMRFVLAPGAEMIGWDVTALGLPASAQPFVAGRFTQTIELPGSWLERGSVRADDMRLLDSALGWAGQRVLATLWFAAGSALAEPRRAALLEAARETAQAHPLRCDRRRQLAARDGRRPARPGRPGRAGDGAAEARVAGLATACLATVGDAAAHLVDLIGRATSRTREPPYDRLDPPLWHRSCDPVRRWT